MLSWDHELFWAEPNDCTHTHIHLARYGEDTDMRRVRGASGFLTCWEECRDPRGSITEPFRASAEGGGGTGGGRDTSSWKEFPPVGME